MKIKVLLLGPDGQLGTALSMSDMAQRFNIEIFPIARRQLDLSSLDSIRSFLSGSDFHVLVNCASYNYVDKAEEEVQEAFLVNGHAVQTIATVCHEKRARLIHISTDFVFEGNINRPYVEADLPAPLSVYGASKLLGEFASLSSHGDVILLRTASLFGVSRSVRAKRNFVDTVLSLGKEKDSLRVIDDITMSPTSAIDLAQIILKLIHGEAEPGIYHVVNSGQATWYQFANEIISLAGIKVNVIPVCRDEFPMKARRPVYSVLNNSKVSKKVGEVPHWKSALKRYLAQKGCLQ